MPALTWPGPVDCHSRRRVCHGSRPSDIRSWDCQILSSCWSRCDCWLSPLSQTEMSTPAAAAAADAMAGSGVVWCTRRGCLDSTCRYGERAHCLVQVFPTPWRGRGAVGLPSKTEQIRLAFLLQKELEHADRRQSTCQYFG